MNVEIESIIAKVQDAQEDLLQYLEKMGEEVDLEVVLQFDSIMDTLREME